MFWELDNAGKQSKTLLAKTGSQVWFVLKDILSSLDTKELAQTPWIIKISSAKFLIYGRTSTKINYWFCPEVVTRLFQWPHHQSEKSSLTQEPTMQRITHPYFAHNCRTNLCTIHRIDTASLSRCRCMFVGCPLSIVCDSCHFQNILEFCLQLPQSKIGQAPQ